MSPVLVSLQTLSIEKVADLWDISVSTLRRMIKRKELPAIKVGGQWRIRLTDLHAFIEKESNTTNAEQGGNADK
jgi:excisionase family DNA binding protein